MQQEILVEDERGDSRFFSLGSGFRLWPLMLPVLAYLLAMFIRVVIS